MLLVPYMRSRYRAAGPPYRESRGLGWHGGCYHLLWRHVRMGSRSQPAANQVWSRCCLGHTPGMAGKLQAGPVRWAQVRCLLLLLVHPHTSQPCQLCCAMLCHVCAVLCHAMICRGVLCCAMLCRAMVCRVCAMPCHGAVCVIVRHASHVRYVCAMSCHAMSCHGVPWRAMPCHVGAV